MRKVIIEKQFKKDAKKHFLELATPSWAEALHALCLDLVLPEKYCDHELSGQYKGIRDCHIKPDLILLYLKNGDAYLQLIRLGSHSELF
jgi:mRNA interferase YafQ